MADSLIQGPHPSAPQITADLLSNGIDVYPQKEFDEDSEDRLVNEKFRVSGSTTCLGWGSGGMALNHGGVASELKKDGGPHVHPWSSPAKACSSPGPDPGGHVTNTLFGLFSRR